MNNLIYESLTDFYPAIYLIYLLDDLSALNLSAFICDFTAA